MKRYRIISELGKGATGVVYRAVRNSDNGVVALKKLVVPGHLDANEEEEFIKRFKNEADAALTLDHAGIVKCLDCGLDEGTFYIAYELIEGVTLEDALKSGRKFSPEEVADILIQATEALQYAHERGVVHRDISPGNIFLGDDAKVRVADFGVAMVTGRSTLTGTGDIVGTPGYMSPEQVKAGDIDHRSDIFSLGCVVYELFSGLKAFPGDNIPQIINQVINHQPKPLREIDASIPLVLEEIVFRMLAKNPMYRYQTMLEVNTAARLALDAIPRHKKPVSQSEEYTKPTLIALKGPHEGERFDLVPPVTTIGSGIGDILLNKDSAVESQHAWLTKEETGWVLYDADSNSGTLLNGEKIEREEILPGDRIKIGETVLEFRGAGNIASIFGADTEDKKESDKKTSSEPRKKVPWVIIAMFGLPAIVLIAAVFYSVYFLPMQTIKFADEITLSRWDSAMKSLDTPDIAEISWRETASSVLNDWIENPLPAKEELYPSKYASGKDKLKTEIDFRYQLFDSAERFIDSAINKGDDIGIGSDSHASIVSLHALLDAAKPPDGISVQWSSRRNQLLALMKKWIAKSTRVKVETEKLSHIPERESAASYLLRGWFLYQEAADDLSLLDQAFRQFESCQTALEPVLNENSTDADACAVSGLSGLLMAKILKGVGSFENTKHWIRALEVLDNVDRLLTSSNETAWERSIPVDFKGGKDYPNLTSTINQASALRISLENSLAQAGVNTFQEKKNR